MTTQSLANVALQKNPELVPSESLYVSKNKSNLQTLLTLVGLYVVECLCNSQ